MKERIVEMLSAGIRPTNVAEAVGVTESYISQIAEECKDQILAARATRTSQHIQHDLTLDTVEDRALGRLSQVLNTVTDPMKLAGVFKVLNGAKRRHESLGNQQSTATVVELELPQIAKVAIRMNTQKQVIEVGGRSMITMQSTAVEKMLERRKEEKAQTQELLESPTAQLPETTVSLLESL